MPAITALLHLIERYVHYLQAIFAIACCIGIGLMLYVSYQVAQHFRKSE